MNTCAYSRDGGLIAGALYDGSIQIWKNSPPFVSSWCGWWKHTVAVDFHVIILLKNRYRTGGKFRAIQDFALFRKFRGPPSTCVIFVSSATHEKREIKNTSKISTRTVLLSTLITINPTHPITRRGPSSNTSQHTLQAVRPAHSASPTTITRSSQEEVGGANHTH